MSKIWVVILFLCSTMAVAAEEAPPTPQQVLDRLVDGNRRFVQGSMLHPHESDSRRNRLTGAQHPVATVLGCSDSRVPVELVFDQGFGDLFVVRVAGHVVDMDVAASVVYGVLHAGTPLVVVLGHENCGAVTAALEADPHEPVIVRLMLAKIAPAIRGLPREAVTAGVEANVRQTVSMLKETPGLDREIQAGRLLIVGGIYSLADGRVRLLDSESKLP